MEFEHITSTVSFRSWIREDAENRRILWWAGIAIILQFLIFKFLYPFPNFMPPDSNSYIEAAFYNKSINFWAIGYSKFLRLFSSFASSSDALVWCQYLFLEASLLYFLFSVKYFLTPGKWLFRMLLGICVLNPLIPHISNFVGSDTLFTALSLVWFTQLCWIIYKPQLRLLIWHSFVLLFVFMVRFNALYYPFISIAVILFAPTTTRIKYLSVGAVVLVIGGFMGSTGYSYYKETGTFQYSAFGGWQIAANALYGYAHASEDSAEHVPKKYHRLQTLVNHHMDSLNRLAFNKRPDNDVAIYYLWDVQSPLKTYMKVLWNKDSADLYFKRWATVAPLYADYGKYIIRHHPVPFLRYYVWPNLIKYYVPPVGFMGLYNIGLDHVEPIVAVWFRWKSQKIQPHFKKTDIKIASFFPVLFGVVNLVFITSLLAFCLLGGFKRSHPTSRSILRLELVIWLSNVVFSVLAAPIELRYQLFPMLITIVFLGLILSFIIKESYLIPDHRPRGKSEIERGDVPIQFIQ